MLAPLRAKSEAPESFGMPGPEECAVLYLSYCLSEDQSWLLATATDDRGEIFETATINIDIPNRKRRKRASARRIGLQKLMDFILGVMSQGVSRHSDTYYYIKYISCPVPLSFFEKKVSYL